MCSVIMFYTVSVMARSSTALNLVLALAWVRLVSLATAIKRRENSTKSQVLSGAANHNLRSIHRASLLPNEFKLKEHYILKIL